MTRSSSKARTILGRLLTLSSGLSIACALATSCGEEPPPEAAPEPVVDAPPPEPLEEPEPEGPPPGIDHTIAEGQTLWAIARAYDVSVSEIMEANRLRPRDVRRLRAGNTLRIPGAEAVVDLAAEASAEETTDEPPPPAEGGAYHRLIEGETLWDVAQLYEVAMGDLMEINELDDESVRTLRPGRQILVPGVSERDVERATRGREQTLAQSRESRGFRHEVSRGETMWDLARTFGVSVSRIMAANGLDEEGIANLREGTRLYIPGVEQDRGGRVRRTVTRAQEAAMRRARSLGLGTRQTATNLLRGRVEPRWIRAAGGNANRLPGYLRWPVTGGWFVRGYGSGEGGYHLATDIMGRIGWNVRAAAPGIVGYSGDEVPGYGNLVMLIHPGGWVTMYAHNSANSVVAGERVPRGGILAEVGSTGISRGPHVHFELMFDNENCDPSTLFRPGIRHRDGHLSPIAHAPWTNPERPPERMRCDRRRRHPNSRWVSHESFSSSDGE
ncbi:MAG: LysM peptidoglycan-binding domain-containing protein [Sandaracinaceae bacterium]